MTAKAATRAGDVPAHEFDSPGGRADGSRPRVVRVPAAGRACDATDRPGPNPAAELGPAAEQVRKRSLEQ